MVKKHLAILNMPHVSQWQPIAKTPRFLQPVEFSLYPCTNCPGHCCDAVVGLTLVEALRITLPLGVPIDDVVEQTPVQEGVRSPARTPPIPLARGPVTLRLRHTPQHRCIFVHPIGARSRCAIHVLRPAVCRAFPFRVEWGNRVVKVGSQTLCPVQWLQDDNTLARVRTDMEEWDATMALEKRLLTQWQRSTEDPSWPSLVKYAAQRLARKWGMDLHAMFPPPRRRLGKPLWNTVEKAGEDGSGAQTPTVEPVPSPPNRE